MLPSRDEPKSAVVAGAPSPPDEPQRAPARGDSAGAANLDKVRDILFGTQLREVERRFSRLEERIVRETTELKEDVKRRLEALEAYARQESESLAGQIRSEHANRVESGSTLSRELREAASALERRAAAIDEQHSTTERDMRQQMLEQHQRLTDEICQKIDDVLAALARETQELRSDKADRTAIASLLTEMALRLTNELRIPGADDLGNG